MAPQRTLFHRASGGEDCDEERLEGVLWWGETDEAIARDDPQAGLVYDWELEITAAQLPEKWRATMPLPMAALLLRAIFDDVCSGQVAAPALEPTAPGVDVVGYYDAGTWTIHIHPYGANALVIIHEIAHALRSQSKDCPGGRGLGAARVGAHGSLFVAQLIAIWSRYIDGFDAGHARERAAAYGIRVTDLPWVVASGDEASRRIAVDALRGILRPPTD